MTSPAASDWLTQWQWSWIGVLLVLLFGGGYLAAWSRAPRRFGIWRPMFVGLACLVLLYVTCGPVGVFSRTYLWVFALRMGLLDVVVPLGFALGRPVEAFGALRSASARETNHVARALVRVLMFPAVSSILGALSVMAVFFTGYGQAAVTNNAVDALLVVHLLATGTCVVLPLVGGELLPSWMGPGLRTLAACLDGLVDALPGIIIMTASSLLMPHFPGFAPGVTAHRDLTPMFDQKLAGGALLAVAESVGLPMLVAVFVDWMRQDEHRAVEMDRHLDELESSSDLTTPWWIQDAASNPRSSERD